jgi:hypothetical protein
MDKITTTSQDARTALLGRSALLGYSGAIAADTGVVHQGTGMSSFASCGARPRVSEGTLLGTKSWSPPV